jgi:hypothetical protein
LNLVPPGTYVSSVLASRHAAGRVYATFDGHFNDDYGAYVAVSDDYGRTWRSLARGLPATAVHRLREHPRNGRLLFVGHERGIHMSIDAGESWSSLNLNMPNVPVDDILIHPRENDLVAATHGRSLWVLDNVSALESLTPDSMKSDAFLVPPARARLLTIYSPQAWFGAGQFFAPNPPSGGVVDYYLREAGKNEVTVRIADSHGAIVRTLKGPAHAGLNRLVWDLRMEPPASAEGAREFPGVAAAAIPVAPLVLPGVYSLTVDAAGRQLKGELKIEGDPRVTFPDTDRRERQTLLVKLYELQKSLVGARTAASAGIAHFDAVVGTARKDHQPQERLLALQTEIGVETTAIASLFRSIEGYSGLPTADQRRQIGWMFDDAAKTVDALNDALRADGARPTQLINIPARP